MNNIIFNNTVVTLVLLGACRVSCAENLDPGFCNAVLDQGISNREQILSDRDKYISTKNNICREQFESFSDMQNRGGQVGINIPLSIGLLGLDVESESIATLFKEKRDKFCKSTFNDFRSSEFYFSAKSMIDSNLLSSWNSCIRDTLDLRLSKFGIYAFAEPQASLDSFLVFVNFNRRKGDPEGLEIRSVLPSSKVTCTYNGNPMPISTESSDIVLECSKNATDPVTVSLNTNLGVTRPSIKIPGAEVKALTLEGLDLRIEQLEGLYASIAKVHKGTVAAFDLNECPRGWSDFRDGQGRFIVGVGNNNGNNKDANKKALTSKKLSNNGGEESHVLTVNELASHTHPYNDTSIAHNKGGWLSGGGSSNNWNNAMNTSASGGNQSHNNMPPFIALRYCIKD